MNKFLSFAFLFLVLTGVGCESKSVSEKNVQQKPIIEEGDKVTRKDELQLEGFINDYFYRRQIVDPFLFGDFKAYGSIVGKSIVVYLYPINDWTTQLTESKKKMIKDGLGGTLLSFPDFEWAKEYGFDIVIKQ